MPRQTLDSLGKSNATAVSSSVENKLLGYAALAGAAGVGVLALAQPSEAEIVYTPAHEKISGAMVLNIDLNGDGINDFYISARSFGRHGAKTFGTRTSAGFFVYPVANTNKIVGSVGFASALAAKVQVGPEAKFNTSRGILGAVSAFTGGPPMYIGAWAPEGASVLNHYLGFKFVIDGQIHYGWARLSTSIHQISKGGDKAQLTGYAYETEPNTPIITGKTSGNDVSWKQPAEQAATLGQLALGSAGLVAWRKETTQEDQAGLPN
jgi:hypothetical protein